MIMIIPSITSAFLIVPYLFKVSLAAPPTDHKGWTFRMPLHRERRPVHSHLERRGNSAFVGLTSDLDFWFANVDVGKSINLSCLVDTGSADLIVNPGLYIPSNRSLDVGVSFNGSYGTTSSGGTGSATILGELFSDKISYGGLSIDQVFGYAAGNATLPHEGIIGFSDPLRSAFIQANAIPFFHTLCKQGVVQECRFGLALENDTGTQILGGLDASLFSGNISIAPILQEWVLNGDITINGRLIYPDAIIELDSGTATVVGPIDAVLSIFNATGIQPTFSSTSDGDLLTGYFPCDKPPRVGISFPSKSNATAAAQDTSSLVSHISTDFEIPLSAWALRDNGNNNCTSVLSGQNYQEVPGLWVVGQRGSYAFTI